MSVEIKVPEVGESITEGRLVGWSKAAGATVLPGETLFELETDKITLSVAAELKGVLTILVPAGTTVRVGQVVGRLEVAAEVGAEPSVGSRQFEDSLARLPPPPAPPHPPVAGEAPPLSAPAGLAQAREKLPARTGELPPLSPAVRRLVEEHRLDPAALQGSGRDGRLTKGDVLAHLAVSPAVELSPPPPVPPPAPPVTAPGPIPTAPGPTAPPPVLPVLPLPATALQPPATPASSPRETRRAMSPLRHRIAERLIQAQQTAAILTTFNEADMSNLMNFRAKHKEKFEKKFELRLGFMSFFVKAVVDALKTVPQLNARIDGDEIVQQHYYDIGVAVGTDAGLVVPIVRDADQLSFGQIEKKIAEFAERARARRLTLGELTGGCFTISNGGVYGSLLSTPILNPPQSGILGLHRIQQRPVVLQDQIVARPMMYLALSYDHRLIDGAEAVTFLKRVVECVEDPERMLLEV